MKRIGEIHAGVPTKSSESFSVCGETLKSREDERIKNRQKSKKKKAPEFCATSTEAPCLLEEMLTGREVLFFHHVQLEPVSYND